jgi:hypothetical protein
LLFQANRFSGLFPIIGFQIITEPSSLEDFPSLERTSYPTDRATLIVPDIIASNLFCHPAHRAQLDTRTKRE